MRANIPRNNFSSREEWLDDRVKTYSGQTLRVWASRSVGITYHFLNRILGISWQVPWAEDLEKFVERYAPHYKDEFDGKR